MKNILLPIYYNQVMIFDHNSEFIIPEWSETEMNQGYALTKNSLWLNFHSVLDESYEIRDAEIEIIDDFNIDIASFHHVILNLSFGKINISDLELTEKTIFDLGKNSLQCYLSFKQDKYNIKLYISSNPIDNIRYEKVE